MASAAISPRRQRKQATSPRRERAGHSRSSTSNIARRSSGPTPGPCLSSGNGRAGRTMSHRPIAQQLATHRVGNPRERLAVGGEALRGDLGRAPAADMAWTCSVLVPGRHDEPLERDQLPRSGRLALGRPAPAPPNGARGQADATQRRDRTPRSGPARSPPRSLIRTPFLAAGPERTQREGASPASALGDRMRAEPSLLEQAGQSARFALGGAAGQQHARRNSRGASDRERTMPVRASVRSIAAYAAITARREVAVRFERVDRRLNRRAGDARPTERQALRAPAAQRSGHATTPRSPPRRRSERGPRKPRGEHEPSRSPVEAGPLLDPEARPRERPGPRARASCTGVVASRVSGPRRSRREARTEQESPRASGPGHLGELGSGSGRSSSRRRRAAPGREPGQHRGPPAANTNIERGHRGARGGGIDRRGARKRRPRGQSRPPRSAVSPAPPKLPH